MSSEDHEGDFNDYGSNAEEGLDVKPIPTEHGQVTVKSMILNLVMIGLGTGILAQPWGLAGASLLTGLTINAAVLVLNAATIMIVVEACEKYKVFDLGRLLTRLPGKLGKVAGVSVNVLIGVSSGAALVGYFIVIYDSLAPYLPSQGILHNRVVVIFLSALLLLPICLVDQSYLSFTSSLGVSVNINLLVLLSAHLMWSGVPEPLCVLGLGSGNITLFSALMFAMTIHMCIPPMYAELQHRTPQNFQYCVFWAFLCLFFIFSGFASLGYACFGPNVRSNILLSLGNTAWTAFTRLSMLLCICSIFPFLMVTVVAPFVAPPVPPAPVSESTGLRLLPKGSPERARPLQPGYFTTTTATTLWMFVFALLACFVTDLGFMTVVSGAMGAAGFVGVVPALIGLYMLESIRCSLFGRISMYFLAIFCTVMSGLGFWYTDNMAEQAMQACYWLTTTTTTTTTS
eukprot:gb/GEZN01007696.1/.p1 GENE.gb/GEZN01007696.1/~~gb/GEZN01007696.1/.p1  ORF type:complete len:457 (-),score=48.87 gb/GEZN01007696.1/:110-1480(-)